MKNPLSIFLALLVLMGNMGMTFSTHYCCGISVKHVLAIGQHALDCGMAGMDEHTGPFPADHHTVLDKVCCKDQHQTMDVDDVYEPADTPSIPLHASVFCSTLEALHICSYSGDSAVPLTYHPPPPSGQDILLFQQVFRL